MQIYPEVTVVYDDDCLERDLPRSLTALSPQEDRYAFRWLLTSGRVYLLRWDPRDHTHVVYREPDGNIINCLRRHYLPHRAAMMSRGGGGKAQSVISRAAKASSSSAAPLIS